ncbi:hypothetical protein BMI88_18190 [Thioclava sp. F36-6]|nr:hypothetical protein BMI88_18190 [Thioclava sp. F36-6]
MPEFPGLVARPADADLPAVPELPPALLLPPPLPPLFPPPLPPPFPPPLPPPLPFLAKAASAPVKWLVATGATTKLAATRATIEVFLRRMRPSSFVARNTVSARLASKVGKKAAAFAKCARLRSKRR